MWREQHFWSHYVHGEVYCFQGRKGDEFLQAYRYKKLEMNNIEVEWHAIFVKIQGQ